jgi:hypothetical protein
MPPSARSSWFRVGTYDVNTSTLVAVLGTLSMFVYAVDKTLLNYLSLSFYPVREGQIWRLFTWPLVNNPDIWVALALYLFWMFGSQLEDLVGKHRFLWLLAVTTAVPAILVTLFSFLIDPRRSLSTAAVLFHIPIGGIRFLEIAIFVAYVAEFPGTRFFFGLKSWVVAAVLVALDVLRFLGDQLYGYLLMLFFVIAVALVMLRSMGLGRDLPSWIPSVALPQFMSGTKTKGTYKPKRETKAGKLKSAIKRAEKAEASVTDISTMRPMEVSPEAKRARQAKIDGILDKISAHGINSLDEEELTILNERKR